MSSPSLAPRSCAHAALYLLFNGLFGARAAKCALLCAGNLRCTALDGWCFYSQRYFSAPRISWCPDEGGAPRVLRLPGANC